MEKIIEKLKEEARNSWGGEIGEQRAVELESYLRDKLHEYSEALQIPKKELLEAWEKNRNYSAINYYQEAVQPSLKGEDVYVFNTVDHAIKAFERKAFRCPSCEGISTNPYRCDSGIKNEKGIPCNWTVDGLFGDLGKGVYIFIKEEMRGERIFKPITWEKEQNVG